MRTLKAQIRRELEGAKRVALLGVGSDLRGDDAAGIIAAGHLEAACKKIRLKARLKVFIGATAPENLTGEIKRFKPTHLIIIDSADMRKPEGVAALIKTEEVSGISFCTHQLPLSIMVDYLKESLGCRIIILGIQPKNIAAGSLPSKKIILAAKNVSGIIKHALMEDR